jgi:hypothetical protein
MSGTFFRSVAIPAALKSLAAPDDREQEALLAVVCPEATRTLSADAAEAWAATVVAEAAAGVKPSETWSAVRKVTQAMKLAALKSCV